MALSMRWELSSFRQILSTPLFLHAITWRPTQGKGFKILKAKF